MELINCILSFLTGEGGINDGIQVLVSKLCGRSLRKSHILLAACCVLVLYSNRARLARASEPGEQYKQYV
jgi:hypothetical protein